jgi:insertion element IS1 protein InsB
MNSPRCDSENVVKNGLTQSGKQNFKCRECGRHFVQNPRHQPIPEETQALIDKLFLEKISLAVIVRVTGVSPRWLQYYINQKFAFPDRFKSSQKKGKLTIQCDEITRPEGQQTVGWPLMC